MACVCVCAMCVLSLKPFNIRLIVWWDWLEPARILSSWEFHQRYLSFEFRNHRTTTPSATIQAHVHTSTYHANVNRVYYWILVKHINGSQRQKVKSTDIFSSASDYTTFAVSAFMQMNKSIRFEMMIWGMITNQSSTDSNRFLSTADSTPVDNSELNFKFLIRFDYNHYMSLHLFNQRKKSEQKTFDGSFVCAQVVRMTTFCRSTLRL